jgi:hypothetical protein
VEIGVGGQVWVGLGGMALGSHFWLSRSGLVEIYLYGVVEFFKVF